MDEEATRVMLIHACLGCPEPSSYGLLCAMGTQELYDEYNEKKRDIKPANSPE